VDKTNISVQEAYLGQPLNHFSAYFAQSVVSWLWKWAALNKT